MGKPIDSRALAILKKYELDIKNDQGEYKALWDCHGTWVMYHRYFELAGAKNGIQYKYDEIETNSATSSAVAPKFPLLAIALNTLFLIVSTPTLIASAASIEVSISLCPGEYGYDCSAITKLLFVKIIKANMLWWFFFGCYKMPK